MLTAMPGPSLAVAGGSTTFPDDGAYRWAVALARHTPWLHGPVSLWTSAGMAVPLLLGALGWWLGRGRGLQTVLRVAWVPGAMAVAVAISFLIKSIFAEHRPCQVILVQTVEKCPGATDYSFPSNHTVFAAAGGFALFGVARLLGAIGTVNALVVAATRVYLGVHYPHDVIVGLLVAAAVAGGGLLAGKALLPILVSAIERRLPLGAAKPASSADTIPNGAGQDP